MVASPEDNRKDASGRLHSSERRLTAFDERAREEQWRRASQGAALVRAAQPPGSGARRAQGAGPRGTGAGRPPAPRPGGVGARTGAEADGGAAKANPLGSLSKLFSPKGIEQSMSTIGNLRVFCKQAAKYVQQADSLLDSLFATGNSLKESGLLKKLAESKGKMSTADLTNILLALMNSPIGNTFFKRLGGGESTEGTGTAAGDAAEDAQVGPAPVKRLSPRRPAVRRRTRPQDGHARGAPAGNRRTARTPKAGAARTRTGGARR